MDVEMSATAHAVLVVLCRHADENGQNCFPSAPVIMKKSHLFERTVRKAIKELEAAGWISVTQAVGMPRHFSISVDRIREATPAKNVPPVQSDTPAKNVPPDKNVPPYINRPEPRTKIAGEGVQKCTGTGAKNSPLRDQLREQEKDREVSCALPAGSSAADLCPSVDEFGLTNDFPVEAVKPKKQTKKTKAVTHAFNLETLPEDWAVYCKEVRPDLDPARVFSAFKAYWTMGRGKGTLRADKSWFQSWMNWVKKEDEARTRNTKPVAVEEFSDDRYANAMNPDGSLNWD